MLNPCRFTLDNGQPCGSPAQHFSHFCRHHSPQALRRRGLKTRPYRPETPGSERAQLSLYWRNLHQHIASTDREGLDDATVMLFHALGDRSISPCSAGRLFQAIEDRHRALEGQALLENVLHTANSIAKNGGIASELIEKETLALRRCLQELTTP